MLIPKYNHSAITVTNVFLPQALGSDTEPFTFAAYEKMKKCHGHGATFSPATFEILPTEIWTFFKQQIWGNL